MKKLLIILSVAMVTGLAFVIPSSESEGTDSIEFQNMRLEEVLKYAAEQDKHVYVDVSTSWCGYCRKMKASTYTDPAVIKHINDNYVSVSIDAEKGDGPAIIQKYRVRAYPTELILDETGKLLSKNVGYLKPKELIAFANR